MCRKSMRIVLLILVLMLSSSNMLTAQQTLSVEDILSKNIEAVGGMGNLEKVTNFTFKAGSNTYFVQPDGAMKVIFGMKEPVVIGTIIVTQDAVTENVLHRTRTIEGPEKARLLCLARLIRGLFSLAYFENSFSYGGIKSYGPEKYHIISTKAHGLDIDFLINTENWLLKGMILRSYTPEEGHFEYSYDFGPPVAVMEFPIPSSIFSASVGTQTSTNPEPQRIHEVRFNLALDDRLFSEIEINMGEVSVTPGCLKGHVLDFIFFSPRPSFIVVTNWQRQDVEKAGLRSGDMLMLNLDGIESELTFHISEGEGEYIDYRVPDARFMTMDPVRGGLYFLYFNLENSQEAERIKSKLIPLLPIQVKKISLSSSSRN